jgi:predicted TIM-barrel fold metal-dependent hydrolase
MIVDCHMHVFKHLNGPCGYASAATHLNYLKGSQSMPIRRARDGAVLGSTMDWARVSDFRAERFGRYEWTLDGEAYYVQQFSPSLQTMASSPEFVLAEMEHAGVDVVLLQHDTVYGRYNELFAETMREYPGRFVGLAKVEEPAAYRPEQLRALERCARELGLPGLFFQHGSFGDRASVWAGDGFTPFWDAVRGLGLKLVYMHGTTDYAAIGSVARRYPEVAFMMLLPGVRLAREGQRHVPELVVELGSLPNVLFEITPISYGFQFEYPYREMHHQIRPLYEQFGGTKLCWGSDMPNLERFCTYLQGLDVLRRHCEFIRPDDMDLILGGNAARVLGLTRPRRA